MEREDIESTDIPYAVEIWKGRGGVLLGNWTEIFGKTPYATWEGGFDFQFPEKQWIQKGAGRNISAYTCLPVKEGVGGWLSVEIGAGRHALHRDFTPFQHRMCREGGHCPWKVQTTVLTIRQVINVSPLVNPKPLPVQPKVKAKIYVQLNTLPVRGGRRSEDLIERMVESVLKDCRDGHAELVADMPSLFDKDLNNLKHLVCEASARLATLAAFGG